MSTAGQALVSESESLALPESNQRLELIDGEVIAAPSSSYRHQEVLSRIVTALRNWAADRKDVTVVQAPLDVRFGPGRILQPDAMVFLQALPDEIESPLDRIPEICVEVLSGNRAYDRVTKRYLYGEAGVAEYWIVDPAGVVERRSGSELGELELIETRLTSTLLPGFALDLAAVFARR
jgi:Uma2 family endonuclease